MVRYNQAGVVGNFGATCGNARSGYLFKLKGPENTISLLIDQGIYYPKPETSKQDGTVNGVTGATNYLGQNGGVPIVTGKELFQGGSWYALRDFYQAISEQKLPDSNVLTGARAVRLANPATYNHTVEKRHPAHTIS